MAMSDATTHPLLKDLVTQVAAAISDEIALKVVPARLPLHDTPPLAPLPDGTVVVDAASGKIVPAPVALENRVMVKNVKTNSNNTDVQLTYAGPELANAPVNTSACASPYVSNSSGPVLKCKVDVDNNGNVLVEYHVVQTQPNSWNCTPIPWL